MKKTFLFFFFVFGFNFCLSQDFDATKTKVLFEEFNKLYKTPFDQNTLNAFFKEIKIENLKSGKEIEKELFFENVETNCKDKLKISYHKESNGFVLNVYEKTFVEDLDWCPEHLYFGTFKIKNNKIIKVTFKQVAG